MSLFNAINRETKELLFYNIFIKLNAIKWLKYGSKKGNFGIV